MLCWKLASEPLCIVAFGFRGWAEEKGFARDVMGEVLKSRCRLN